MRRSTSKIVEKEYFSNDWKWSWSCRAKTRCSQKIKKQLKKAAHRRARRGDGVIFLNGYDVI
jgi:hypothetical protein